MSANSKKDPKRHTDSADDGVSRRDFLERTGGALAVKEDLTAATQNVVNLLEILMLVVIGGLASLQRVSRETSEPLETVSFVIDVAVVF